MAEDQRVDMVIKWAYKNRDAPKDAKPNNKAKVIWNDVSYCNMIHVERRLIDLLAELNDIMQKKCDQEGGEPASLSGKL